MSKTNTDAPTDSAPNTPAAVAAATKKEWKKEIHTPEAEYNANVPMDLIERDPQNRTPKPEAVTALAAAIEAEGLLQPIVLRALEGGKYMLIAGEHRWRAYQELKRQTIAARIYKSEDDLSAARKALLENNAREGLSAIERARRFKQLGDLGMKQKEIGLLAGGVSQPVVANALRLLDLPAAVQQMIEDGKLSEAHGVTLAKFAKWPRVCACQARMAHEHGYSAHHLASDGFPFANQCVDEGLIEKFCIKARYLDEGPVYKLPRQFGSHRDFIVGENYVYYIQPEDPKDNVWAPERAKQDAEREKVETVQRARDQASLSKSNSKEAAERAKVMAKNKAQRAENIAGYQLAIDKLKKTTAPTGVLVAIMAHYALKGMFSGKRIQQGAADIGVTLPKGAITEGAYGLSQKADLSKMDPADLAKVVVAVVLGRELEYANKEAWTLPDHIELVMNSKVTVVTAKASKPSKAGRVVIDDTIRSKVRAYVMAGKTGAEIAKGLGISLPTVQNIKKALGLVKVKPATKGKK